MRTIGINGGHTTYDLGTPSDVVLFFDCINAFVSGKYPGKEWGILTDRLYRRYLRFDDLERCSELMELVKTEFNDISASSIKWDKSTLDGDGKTFLAFRSSNLSDVFRRYFEAFSKAKESAKSFYDEFNIYQPVRILVSDLPNLVIEKMRPLEDYDSLEQDATPFWLQ
ncbi:hypothetical protein BRL93_22910 [Xanthomonas oryzae pv. oryzae]|uniref:hypothetical protein n=1 Tax=Xanthomonas oryzae TaxID=347 RepID=UPI000DE04903|nr:hypothetical protein [Xanthomonas oryzae]RBH85820.1 hypothetical protein BRL93_22910 [Xanthomonas oryzae pv. oryzae]